jgi:hypothetical protein
MYPVFSPLSSYGFTFPLVITVYQQVPTYVYEYLKLKQLKQLKHQAGNIRVETTDAYRMMSVAFWQEVTGTCKIWINVFSNTCIIRLYFIC